MLLDLIKVFVERKEQGQFSMAIGNVELMRVLLPVEVDHSQLRIIVSETVDPIDGPLPQHLKGITPSAPLAF